MRSRIIPALAGNTPRADNQLDLRPDHPRSRGEYGRVLGDLAALGGSSPLSRGIPVSTKPYDTHIGIIPALAGNTRAFLDTEDLFPDHPRSRGEYFRSQKDCSWITGSSPLSRGILLPGSCGACSPGIIPALAGNTPVYLVRGLFPGDHPRSRGEYVMGHSMPRSRSGSSPLSRGIQSSYCLRWHDAGIIPALAGNTLPRLHEGCWDGDHPRSRGEYHLGADCHGVSPGSSPLSRGILRSARMMSALGGSSPLSRGIRDHRSRRGIRHRIIPALAGNTSG